MKKIFISVIVALSCLIAQIGMVSIHAENEFVTITIHYLYEDNSTAFDDYKARLQNGADFKSNVQCPTIAGYTPYYENAEVTSISLDYTNLNEDKDYNVIYKPNSVSYQCTRYYQNIYDDEYTIGENQTLTGKVGTVPEASLIAPVKPGFTVVPYDEAQIAADGSTKYNIYYDREYYVASFDLDGGKGVDPIYGRYGTKLKVTNPTKEGYTFAGWYVGDKDGNLSTDVASLPSTMPSYNLKCKAKWNKANSGYSIVFWKQNADDDGYNYFKSVHVDNNITTEDEIAFSSINDYLLKRTDTPSVLPNSTYELDYYHINEAKSDKKVTVAGDGSTIFNVYYDRNTYNLRFYYAKDVSGTHYISQGTNAGDYKQVFNWDANINTTSVASQWNSFINGAKTEVDGNTTYYYDELTNLKYGQKISDVWPANGPMNGVTSISIYNAVSWGTESGTPYFSSHSNKNIKGAYDTMSAELIKDPNNQLAQSLMLYTNSGAVQYKYEIILQNIDDSYPTEPNLSFNVRSTDSGDGQNPFKYNGFTFSHKEYADGAGKTAMGGTVKFYYKRNKFTIDYFYNNKMLTGKSKQLYYDQDLKDAIITPEYPSNLLPGAYRFDGWYLSPTFSQDTKVEPGNDGLTHLKVPNGNISLYAKWTKVTHDVKVYDTYADYLNDTNHCCEYNPVHGTTVSEIENYDECTHDEQEGYTFIGWFYINDEGARTPFDFKNTEVKKDLKVFPVFRSNQIGEYTVKYSAIDANGNVVKENIAPSENYKGYGGMTKTLVAKAGHKLDKDYQSGWYPTVSTHSIIIGEDPEVVDGKQVYTFYYKECKPAPYTVKYIDQETGNELLPTKEVNDNNLAVTTEKFEFVSGYIPDNYYKQLVVSATPDDNVITFYYTKNQTHAPYIVKYYVENETVNDDVNDLSNYSEYGSAEGIGEIGKNFTADTPTIDGYELVPDQTLTKQMVKEGIEIDVLYRRKTYNYQVNYLINNSNEAVKAQEKGEGRYKTTISQTAPKEIEYKGNIYSLITNETSSLEIDSKESNNVINFYYAKKQIYIKYEKIFDGNESAQCQLSMTQEMPASQNDIIGSKPIISDPHYVFEGWYSDQTCQNKITTTNDQLMPEFNTATYYAKFKQRYQITYSTNIPGYTLDSTKYPTTYKEVNTNYTLPQMSAGDLYQFIGWKIGDNTKDAGTNIVMDGDKAIQAILHPKYQIKYYKQQLDGTYQEQIADEVTNYGALNSTVNAAQKTYTNYHYNSTTSNSSGTIINPIANANKYLVLNMYYDLDQYAVTFTTNDSSLTLTGETYNTQTVKHGAKIKVPQAPNFDSHIFTGWTIGNTSVNVGQEITITQATQLVANYTKETVYQVEYYKEQLDGTYTKVETTTEITADIGATVTAAGKTYDNYHLNATKSNASGTVIKPALNDGNHLILKMYYDLDQYDVTFTTNDSSLTLTGESYNTQTVKHGAKIKVPQAPDFDSHIFTGWTIGNTSVKVGQEITITQATQLVANYTKETVYQVEYYKEQLDGTYTKVETTTEITADIGATVTAAGKTYDNYHLNATKSNASGTVIKPALNDGNHLILKMYYDLDQYDVTFTTNDLNVSLTGDTYKTQTVKHGAKVIVPEGQTISNYTFTGWTLNGNKVTVGDQLTITQTTQLIANYSRSTTPIVPTVAVYQVEYYKEEADGTYTLSETVPFMIANIGSTVSATQKQYDHYIFNEESSTSSGTVINPALNEGKYLVLKMYYDRDEHHVTYKTNDANVTLTGDVYNTKTVKHGAQVTVPAAPDVKDYIFTGWTVDGNKVNVGDQLTVTKDMELIANYTRKAAPIVPTVAVYQVEYYQEQLDGTYEKVETTPFILGQIGSQVMAEENTYDYYRYNESKSTSIGIVINPAEYDGKHLILKMYYDLNQYQVSFDTNDANLQLTEDIYKTHAMKHGDTFIVPPAKEFKGYTFDGWTLDGKKVNIGDQITINQDCRFVANYTLQPSVTVSSDKPNNILTPTHAKTGDDINVSIYVGLAIVSVIIVIVVLIKKKRK